MVGQCVSRLGQRVQLELVVLPRLTLQLDFDAGRLPLAGLAAAGEDGVAQLGGLVVPGALVERVVAPLEGRFEKAARLRRRPG